MKHHLNVTVDLDIYLELKNRGIKKSELVNKLLKQYLEIKDEDEEKGLSELKAEYEKSLALATHFKAKIEKIDKENEKRVWV